jgi:succinoglycan biosynthesis transport protein ExoP
MAGQIQPVSSGPMVRAGGMRPMGMMAAGMTPKEMMGILRRHIFLISALTIVGFIVGVGAWFLLRTYLPKYTAKAFIEVSSGEAKDPTDFIEAQLNKDLYYQRRFTKAMSIKQLSMLQDLLEVYKIRETDWFRQFCDVDKDGNITNIGKAITKAVEDLEDNLGASAPRDAQWIQLSMTCGSARESALIVNEMAQLFLRQQREGATADTRAQLTELTNQQRVLKEELQAIDNNLDVIRSGTEHVNLENVRFRDYMDQKLGTLEVEADRLENEISNFESIVETLRVRAEGEFDIVIREQIERDPIASEMRRRIALMEPLLSQQLERLGEEHRQVKETKAALQQMRNDLALRQVEIADIVRKSNLLNAEDRMTAFKQQLDTLTRQLQDTQRQYQDMDKVRAAYQRTMAMRDEKRELLKEVTSHITKLNIVKDDPEISKLKLMGLAPEPLRISAPQWKIYFPGGFILGLMAGIGLAFAIEMLNDLVRTPSDVIRHLRVPLLGMICHADEDDAVEGLDLCHVVRQAPYSIMSECYRQFRTNLKLSGSGGSRKSLLVTSCGPGEGKTSIAVNISATFVAEDSRVLFIDTNFRRPSTGTLFPDTGANGRVLEHPDFGLSNYLMGQCDYDKIVRPSGIVGFDIIDSGPLPSNPAEILGSERMRKLLRSAEQAYNYIVLDGPPLLISDAKTLAAEVDGTILVMNATLTRRGAAQRAVRELGAIKANIVGGVLLGVRTMKGGYFQEMFRSYERYQQVHAAGTI